MVLTLVSPLDVAEHKTYSLSCVLRRRRHCVFVSFWKTFVAAVGAKGGVRFFGNITRGWICASVLANPSLPCVSRESTLAAGAEHTSYIQPRATSADARDW